MHNTTSSNTVEAVLHFLDPHQAPDYNYFGSNGNSFELDLSKVHSRTILAKPMPLNARLDREGFARTNLRPFLLDVLQLEREEEDDDDAHAHACLTDTALRQAVDRFWKSVQGRELLQQQGQDDSNCEDHHACASSSRDNTSINKYLTVVPTHVTRRQAPPDHISFVHIDYPTTHSLSTLVREHFHKWSSLSSSLLPLPRGILDLNGNAHNARYNCRFRLEDVFTIWVCLSPNLVDYPLFIADKQSVSVSSTFVYPVGSCGANKKRHSVGVSHGDGNQALDWYHPFPMQLYDALVFDTRRCPHASAAVLTSIRHAEKGTAPHHLDDNRTDRSPAAAVIRKSAEIRCLVLSSQEQPVDKQAG